MYTLFVQKKQREPSPFPLTEQLHQFILDTDANGIFVCPGHLSRGATKIQRFLDSFLDGTNIKKVGIGNKFGFNSITTYEKYLSGRNMLWNVRRNGISDHRKMIFILKIKDPDDLPTLDKKNYQALLTAPGNKHYIEVLGVAVGSSNFSHPTYGLLTPNVMTADKGEADILMFFNETFKNRFVQQVSDAFVLSESITPVGYKFFMEMFMETLAYTLV